MADERTEDAFASIFGLFQVRIGNAVEEFYTALGEPNPDCWMDDQRALRILEVGQADARHRGKMPATWFQHYKLDRYPEWLLRIFPVKWVDVPTDTEPWRRFCAHVMDAWKDQLAAKLAAEAESTTGGL